MEAQVGDLDFFTSGGFQKRSCENCGGSFWTKDPEATTCGDTPCSEYSFIGAPGIKGKFDIDSMREHYLTFFEKKGHKRIDRLPVVARWRDDVFLVNASIYDFQPHVTSGESPPPANPLVISQPCIRLVDLDSAGRTGRHTSNFEMLAHHAFNSQDEMIYWKDTTVELCHELFCVSLGVDEAKIRYKENPWIGGGNGGASLEVLVDGLELATLVFMDLKLDPNGPVEVKGDRYSKMDLEVVDTGYGLERMLWASTGTPTIYDTLYPDVLSRLMESAGITPPSETEYASVFAEQVKLAGLMDIDSTSQVLALRKEVCKRLAAKGVEIDLETLLKFSIPLENLYALADHARCLGLMLGDGMVPSNVKSGYLLRWVLRRAIRLRDDLGIPESLADIVMLHKQDLKAVLDLEDKEVVIRDILDLESQRYKETVSKGKAHILRQLQKLQPGEGIPTDELVTLYDTHGIQPAIVKSIADEKGIALEIPDGFTTLVANRHEPAPIGSSETFEEAPKVAPTKKLYYEDPKMRVCEAKVLALHGNKLVVDQSVFYPEGGGQPGDTGTIITNDGSSFEVEDTSSVRDVILHSIKAGGESGGRGGGLDQLKPGDTIKMVLDAPRRLSLMQNHTATHLILAAAREELGGHIWQSGAQKGVDYSRLDVTHYKKVSSQQVRSIERRANVEIFRGREVHIHHMPREEAEKRWGLGLYQGGAPAHKDLRVVEIVGLDAQACGGVHTTNTNEVGLVKVNRVVGIQDGIIRFEFSAGAAALDRLASLEEQLQRASDHLSVTPDQLPSSVLRFFNEWKDLRKQLDSMRSKDAKGKVSDLMKGAEVVGDHRVVTHVGDYDMKALIGLASQLTADEKVIAVLGSTDGRMVVGRSNDVDLDAREIMSVAMEVLEGKGGGKADLAQGGGKAKEKIDSAVKLAKDRVLEKIG